MPGVHTVHSLTVRQLYRPADLLNVMCVHGWVRYCRIQRYQVLFYVCG
jgi:hypothetical protein